MVFEIDVNGARSVLERYPEACSVFVDAPDREEQEARLRGRGDSPERVVQRLAKADEEAALADAELGQHRGRRTDRASTSRLIAASCEALIRHRPGRRGSVRTRPCWHRPARDLVQPSAHLAPCTHGEPMADRFDTMMDPRVEELLDRTQLQVRRSCPSRPVAPGRSTATTASWATALGTIVPPQVPSTASKSLSIAFEEIAADKIVGVRDRADRVRATGRGRADRRRAPSRDRLGD